ncbi:DUF2642 domain-containing protein [Psychrobacillus psychrotolerans]|uniref:DUF2642 domain-containing protein n=1 Tax=Psychrobacillus psychrotolerans TaxID=126156 RepID=UPI003B0242F0
MQKRNFENVLYANEKKSIGLYLANNQFVEGILLDIQENHIVLEVNENTFYIAIHQIQAISKNTTDLSLAKKFSPYLVRNDMTDVLIALRYQWVTVNKYGIPTLYGILSSIFEDHIILINRKELFFIPISHITDISSNISESDLYFSNKKEQLAIQKLYRFSISKGSIEVRNENLSVEQDRTKLMANKIVANVTAPLREPEVRKNTTPGELTEKVSTLVSKQEVEAVTIGITDKLVDPIKITGLEDNDTSAKAELEQKGSSGDLAIAEAIILELEEEVSSIDEVESEVTDLIAEDKLLDKAIPPQSEEQLEIYLDEIKDQIEEEQVSFDSNEELNIPEKRSKVKGKDVLLTAWSSMNSDQSTITLPKKNDLKNKMTPPIENKLVTTSKPELNEQTDYSKQFGGKSDGQDKLDILDNPPRTLEKKKPQLNVNVMSKKEVNEMLEQQYFALMNYAAVQISNAVNFKQTDNKLYFHPRVEGSPEKVRQYEMIYGYPIYDSRHDTAAIEKQYISLMRHATTMYRKLRR